MIIAGQFGGKPAPHAPAIYDQVGFGVFFFHFFVDELHVTQHFSFTSFARAFAKTTVVQQHHVIVIAVKVFGVPGPAFDAPGIAVEIKDQPFGLVPEKMQAIDADTRFNVKKIFPERRIVFKLEILFELFRFEDEFFLEEIGQDGKHSNTSDDIPDKGRQTESFAVKLATSYNKAKL